MAKIDELDSKYREFADKCTRAAQADKQDEVAILKRQKAAAKAEWHKEYIRVKHDSRK